MPTLSEDPWRALDLHAPFVLMKFTLTFDGELSSTGNSSRKGATKWKVRKALAPQIAELCRVHPTLRHFMHEQREHSPFAPIEVAHYEFIPLVRRSLSMVCGLNILFLRKEEPGSLVLQG